MLEQADRARKQAEQELCDTNEQLADLTVQNQGLYSSKRKLESDLADLRVSQKSIDLVKCQRSLMQFKFRVREMRQQLKPMRLRKRQRGT